MLILILIILLVVTTVIRLNDSKKNTDILDSEKLLHYVKHHAYLEKIPKHLEYMQDLTGMSRPEIERALLVLEKQNKIQLIRENKKTYVKFLRMGP